MMAVYKATRWDKVSSWIEKRVLKWFFLFAGIYLTAQIIRSLI